MAKLNVVITEKEADWWIFGLAPFVVIAAEPNQHLFFRDSGRSESFKLQGESWTSLL
jgi:hypothetical protein